MPPKGRHKAAAPKPPGSSTSNPSPPNWPALQPLVPLADLHLTTLVPKQILTISNFWTSTLCKTFVSFLSSLPLETTPGNPRRGDALRINDRYQIHDPVFARTLWESTALKELVLGGSSEGREDPSMTEAERRELWGGTVIGLNPNIRVYRYRKGQFFGQHYDAFNIVTLPTSPPTPVKTTWTLLLYLTSPATGCTGGETVFYPEAGPASGSASKAGNLCEPVVVGLQTGMALLHKHGADCMLHEGREVLDGEKWVLRSDLCVRR